MSYQPPQRIVYEPPIQPQNNAMAVTSLVLGIIAGLIGIWSPFPIFGIVAGLIAFLPALLAIIFGHAGLRSAKRSGAGRGQALTGLILGYVTIGVIVAVALFWAWLLAVGA